MTPKRLGQWLGARRETAPHPNLPPSGGKGRAETVTLSERTIQAPLMHNLL